MLIARLVRQLASPCAEERELSESQAYELFCALLDHGVAELEAGAILTAFAMRRLAVTELAGLRRAAQERLNRLPAPQGAARPVVIPSYAGSSRRPNLMPLVALLLAKFGLPVLVHGTLDGPGRVASATVFRELGVLPCAGLRAAQHALAEQRIAFVPTALLSPGLMQLLALRGRLGVPNCSQLIAPLLDPFGGAALKLVPASDATQHEAYAAVLAAQGEDALVFVGVEGEGYPDPSQRPAIECVRERTRRLLFDAHPAPVAPRAAPLPAVPRGADARPAARWIALALAGQVAIPQPILNLLACGLYATGYTDDFSQAKAIVAVRAHPAAVA
jgi:anthranilate phosphoribosyltransferase